MVLKGGVEQQFMLPNHPEWDDFVSRVYQGNLFRALVCNGWDADKVSAWLMIPGMEGRDVVRLAVTRKNGGFVVSVDKAPEQFFGTPSAALSHAAELYLAACASQEGQINIIRRKVSSMKAKDILLHPLMAISGKGYWCEPVHDWVDSPDDATQFEDIIMPWNMPHHGWMRVGGISIESIGPIPEPTPVASKPGM